MHELLSTPSNIVGSVFSKVQRLAVAICRAELLVVRNLLGREMMYTYQAHTEVLHTMLLATQLVTNPNYADQPIEHNRREQFQVIHCDSTLSV